MGLDPESIHFYDITIYITINDKTLTWWKIDLWEELIWIKGA